MTVGVGVATWGTVERVGPGIRLGSLVDGDGDTINCAVGLASPCGSGAKLQPAIAASMTEKAKIVRYSFIKDRYPHDLASGKYVLPS